VCIDLTAALRSWGDAQSSFWFAECTVNYGRLTVNRSILQKDDFQ
jgi:hypothetical protein